MMAIAVSVGIEERLVDTGFIAGIQDGRAAVVTALHLLGTGQSFRIGLPPHFGDLSKPQKYPLQQIRAMEADLVTCGTII
jgi:hypothetical protein